MKKILVIDDEPGHRLMVRAVLEDAGWRVAEAESAEDALRFLGLAANPEDRAENVVCGAADGRQSRPIAAPPRGRLSPDPAKPAAFFSGSRPLAPVDGGEGEGGEFPDVVLLDMHLPGMDGQAALEKIRAGWPELPVVLLTAFGSVGSAVEAMKKGAFDYLSKPADNDELCAVLGRAWDYSNLLKQQRKQRLNPLESEPDPLSRLVGRSGPMRKLHELIRQAGPSEATVLILGESGTGKELIAESLHAVSPRSNAPLIKINCAALPADLLESELFGHEKGAFTGAFKDKPGRFLLADGGTIFLDEIGELPQELQAKLLRVLQERTIEPLGGVRGISVDVRILAATNRDLRREVQAGRFREDLYFRLNVLEIQSPPLRERLEDLPELTSRLLFRLCRKNRKEVRGLAPDFLEALGAYGWPGNVRELENVLERSLILSRGDTLSAASLPEHVLEARADFASRAPRALTRPGKTIQPDRDRAPAASSAAGLHDDKRTGSVSGPVINMGGDMSNDMSNDMGGGPGWNKPVPANKAEPAVQAESMERRLEEAEKQALNEALNLHQGHRERTADALGVSRRTLQYKLKKYGLTKR